VVNDALSEEMRHVVERPEAVDEEYKGSAAAGTVEKTAPSLPSGY
jgi:hypothetical protein